MSGRTALWVAVAAVVAVVRLVALGGPRERRRLVVRRESFDLALRRAARRQGAWHVARGGSKGCAARGAGVCLQRDEVAVLLVDHVQVALDVQRMRPRQEGQADRSRLRHGRQHRVAHAHLVGSTQ